MISMDSSTIFADVHCHPLLKYFQSDKVDLWEPIGTPNVLANLFGVLRFSASDFKNLAQGEVQVVCVALTPPEQKTFFFQGSFPDSILNKFSSFISRIPPPKIKLYQSENYDHFELLNKERALYLGGQNISVNIKLGSTGKKTRCRFKLVRNFGEIETILNNNKTNTSERTIAVVLTIEAAHGLGCGHVEFNGVPNKYNVGEDMLLKRADALKGLDSAEVKGWEQSPLWVTLAHAFNNQLCGHSQALTGGYRKVFEFAEPFTPEKTPPKYQPSINTGFTTAGKKVIERLLGIDAVSASRSIPGKRVQVDIKHMSTRSRKEYYDIIDAHNNANPGDIIPVIMSHAAVNGKPTIDEKAFNPTDTDEEYEKSAGFNPWSINLYDDEIIRIHKTKGLIGLTFYEPLLSGKQKKKGMFFWSQGKWAELSADQILHIVKTVYNTGASDKKEIWDRICIGSDFDGQINPADKFGTSERLPSFKISLIQALNHERFNQVRNKTEVKELADKICYRNALDFLKKNFK